MKQIFDNYEEMLSRIHPLSINELNGRVLRIPASKKSRQNREILMLYGHHSSLERVYGIAENAADYGNVTLPDLPGFGGMDSFYEIGMKPTLDNMADYLATFVKLRYRGKRLSILAMSLGFVVATRMLQRYPELAKKVDVLVSMVGFTRVDDFTLSKNRQLMYKNLCRVFKSRVGSSIFYNLALNPLVLKTFYGRTHNAKNKFKHLTNEQKKAMMNFEIILWRNNEVRTYMETSLIMLGLDNCQKQVLLPVHHISVDGDQYFDNRIVEQHMRVIFTDFFNHTAVMPNHAPTVISKKEEAANFMPDSLRKILQGLPPAKKVTA